MEDDPQILLFVDPEQLRSGIRLRQGVRVLGVDVVAECAQAVERSGACKPAPTVREAAFREHIRNLRRIAVIQVVGPPFP